MSSACNPVWRCGIGPTGTRSNTGACAREPASIGCGRTVLAWRTPRERNVVMEDSGMRFIAHPKLVKVGEYTFRIMCRTSLTDRQALNAAVIFCRTHKMLKKHRKGVVTILSLFDEESARLLGE